MPGLCIVAQSSGRDGVYPLFVERLGAFVDTSIVTLPHTPFDSAIAASADLILVVSDTDDSGSDQAEMAASWYGFAEDHQLALATIDLARGQDQAVESPYVHLESAEESLHARIAELCLAVRNRIYAICPLGSCESKQTDFRTRLYAEMSTLGIDRMRTVVVSTHLVEQQPKKAEQIQLCKDATDHLAIGKWQRAGDMFLRAHSMYELSWAPAYMTARLLEVRGRSADLRVALEAGHSALASLQNDINDEVMKALHRSPTTPLKDEQFATARRLQYPDQRAATHLVLARLYERLGQYSNALDHARLAASGAVMVEALLEQAILEAHDPHSSVPALEQLFDHSPEEALRVLCGPQVARASVSQLADIRATLEASLQRVAAAYGDVAHSPTSIAEVLGVVRCAAVAKRDQLATAVRALARMVVVEGDRPKTMDAVIEEEDARNQERRQVHATRLRQATDECERRWMRLELQPAPNTHQDRLALISVELDRVSSHQSEIVHRMENRERWVSRFGSSPRTYVRLSGWVLVCGLVIGVVLLLAGVIARALGAETPLRTVAVLATVSSWLLVLATLAVAVLKGRWIREERRDKSELIEMKDRRRALQALVDLVDSIEAERTALARLPVQEVTCPERDVVRRERERISKLFGVDVSSFADGVAVTRAAKRQFDDAFTSSAPILFAPGDISWASGSSPRRNVLDSPSNRILALGETNKPVWMLEFRRQGESDGVRTATSEIAFANGRWEPWCDDLEILLTTQFNADCSEARMVRLPTSERREFNAELF